MTTEQLNSLFRRYRQTKCQVLFSELYAGLAAIKKANERMLIRSGHGGRDDAETIFDDTLIKLTQRDDVEDITKLLPAALKRARLHFLRTERRRDTRFCVTDLQQQYGDDSEDAPTSPQIAVDEETPEQIYLEKKKKADQLQLVDFLLESSQILSDPVMVAAIDGIKDGVRISTISKSLNIHHEAVKRKLRALSRRYDSNRFGDIREYLAV